MSDVNEKAAARDATNWAKKVSTLNVAEVPEGAININVEGKRLAGPIQGFGKMWQKTYQVRLPRERVSATDLIATWKQRFPEFWPEGNSFYGPLTGIAPGEVALLNMTLPGKMKLSTGVMVLYADEESFTLMTPQGHMFAGWITFSATEVDAETVAQAQVLMRASDPIFEMGLTMGGHKQEDRFWQHTLARRRRRVRRAGGRGRHPGRVRRQEAPMVQVAQRLALFGDPLDALHARRPGARREAAVCLTPSSSARARTGWPRPSPSPAPAARCGCSRRPTRSGAGRARRS